VPDRRDHGSLSQIGPELFVNSLYLLKKKHFYTRCAGLSVYALLTIYSTTVYIPSSELELSHYLSRQRMCPSPRKQSGGREHTRLRVKGWGSTNSDDWRKSLILCLLCDKEYVTLMQDETQEYSLSVPIHGCPHTLVSCYMYYTI
jgi:hypothetical protein